MNIFKKISENKFLFIAVFLYLLVTGFLALGRHYQFQTQAWDMGIFEQTMWNTTNGRIMENSLEEIPNHLGIHMSPFLFLLIPLYVFFQSPYFLLVLQTLALGLAAIPLFFFTKKITGQEKWAKLIVVSYFLNPALHSVSLFDFHAIAFFIPFIFASFYFFEKGNFFWTFVFIFLAASTKEDAALVCTAIVFYWFLKSIFYFENKKIKIKKLSKKSKNILKLFIVTVLYFLISIKIIMPHFGGGLLRIDRYQELGGSFFEIIRNILFNPKLFFSVIFIEEKIKYLLFLFLPVLFLPFLSLSFIFVLLPGILENILTNHGTQYSGLYQYDAIIIPGLYISAVYGLVFLLGKLKKEKVLFFAILVASLFSFYNYSLFLKLDKVVPHLFEKNERIEAYRQIVKMIPDKVSVAAHTNLVPHLSHREIIKMVGNEGEFTDVIIIDRYDKFGFNTDEQFQAYFDSRINSGLYNMSLIDDRYIILKKKDI